MFFPPPSDRAIQALSNITNTRGSVSSGYLNIEKRVEHTSAADRTTFGDIRGVWIADEPLPRTFDISSQAKQKLRNTETEK